MITSDDNKSRHEFFVMITQLTVLKIMSCWIEIHLSWRNVQTHNLDCAQLRPNLLSSLGDKSWPMSDSSCKSGNLGPDPSNRRYQSQHVFEKVSKIVHFLEIDKCKSFKFWKHKNICEIFVICNVKVQIPVAKQNTKFPVKKYFAIFKVLKF